MGQALDNIQSSPTRERGTEVEVWLLQAGPQLLQSHTWLGGSVPPAHTYSPAPVLDQPRPSEQFFGKEQEFIHLTEETVTATEFWEALQRKLLDGIILDRKEPSEENLKTIIRR